MKKILLSLTLLAMIFAFASCTKDPEIRQGKKDIVGVWTYEKAEVRRIGSEAVNDITSNYATIRMDFNRGGMFYQNGGFQGDKEGKWTLEADYIYTGSEDGPMTAKGKVILQYKKVHGEEEGKHIEWVDAEITDNKITCLRYENGSEYRYTLVKQ